MVSSEISSDIHTLEEFQRYLGKTLFLRIAHLMSDKSTGGLYSGGHELANTVTGIWDHAADRAVVYSKLRLIPGVLSKLVCVRNMSLSASLKWGGYYFPYLRLPPLDGTHPADGIGQWQAQAGVR